MGALGLALMFHVSSIEVSGTLDLRFFRKLCIVPDCDNPYCVFINTVEQPIWRRDELPIRKVRKLRNTTTGFGKTLESSQLLLDVSSERPGGGRLVTPDECDSIEELPAC